jgi:hypothetical protein
VVDAPSVEVAAAVVGSESPPQPAASMERASRSAAGTSLIECRDRIIAITIRQ